MLKRKIEREIAFLFFCYKVHLFVDWVHVLILLTLFDLFFQDFKQEMGNILLQVHYYII